MKRELPLAVALTLLASSVAQALGLGPIERRSALNEPFEARIPLTGASAEDLDTLRVSLASPDAFRRAGLERGLLATRLRFELVQPPSGTDFIRVTTRDPVGEPFVSFLVELNWAAGRLFREYTALLDPPNYQRTNVQVTAPAPASAQPVATPAAPPARAPGAAASSPEPQPVPPPTATPAPESAATSEAFSGEVRVERGDTLWGLADPVARRAGVSTAQALVALWRANPDAFVAGNMNALRAGAILRLPDSSALAGLSNAEALALMAQQNDLWQEYRSGRASAAPSAPVAVAAPEEAAPEEPAPASAAPAPPASTGSGTTPAPAEASTDDPRLKLLAPAPEDATQAGDAGLRKELELSQEEIESRQAENDDLRTRLDEAERLIAQLERALEVRSDELARLQEQLGAGPAGEAADAGSAALPDAPDAASPEQGTDAPADTLAATDDEPVAATDESGAVAQEDAAAEAETDPLAVLERDLEASEAGTDILAGSSDAAEQAVEPMVDESPEPTAPVEASGETPAMVDDTRPADTAPQPAVDDAMAADGKPDAPSAPPPAAAGPTATPVPASTTQPAAVDPADALTRWAESVVPPEIARSVPGGPVAALGAAGAALLALLGVLGARLGRRRKPIEVAAEAKAGKPRATPRADTEATQPGLPATNAAATAAATAASGAAAEATDPTELRELTDVPLEERTLEATARELAGEAPTAGEVDDLFTEMNVYLAYEQFDQAEALVRRAISKAPQDARRHQYLLDIFYAKGDAAAFETAAATVRDLTDGRGPVWEGALNRWQELAPGRELFSDAAVDESFEVASQRTFVDLTAEDLAPRSPPPDAERTLDAARTVDASNEEDEEDPYSATATYAPGALPAPAAPAEEGAPAPAPASLDFDLAQAPDHGGGRPLVEPASTAGVPVEDAFFDLTGDESGLAFADDSAAPALASPAGGEQPYFDPTSGEELTLLDVSGGEGPLQAALAPEAENSEVVDITLGSASDAVAGQADMLDITGGGEPSEDDLGTVRLEPPAFDLSATAGELTRGLDPSVHLLDITATGATPGRDLQDILDVSLDGGGLGDLLDVSGPAPEGAGAIDTAAFDHPWGPAAPLDVALEFDVTGLAQDSGPGPASVEGQELTLGMPSLDPLEGVDFSLDGEQNLGDTFDRPHSMGVGGDDDTQSLDELAQALEETANRMSAPSTVPALDDFSYTRSEAMPPLEPGAFEFASAPEVPEPGDLGVIDFDLLNGGAPAQSQAPLGQQASGGEEQEALSLEDLEAALAGGFPTHADHAGDVLEGAGLGDLSSADSWLNLAHAYIEIGDPASAREELERVLAEGSPEQQAQARQLLEQIRD